MSEKDNVTIISVFNDGILVKCPFFEMNLAFPGSEKPPKHILEKITKGINDLIEQCDKKIRSSPNLSRKNFDIFLTPKVKHLTDYVDSLFEDTTIH